MSNRKAVGLVMRADEYETEFCSKLKAKIYTTSSMTNTDIALIIIPTNELEMI